jgi:predicted  nucleic acid-binding Zn-ribbon protein
MKKCLCGHNKGQHFKWWVVKGCLECGCDEFKSRGKKKISLLREFDYQGRI